MAKFTPTRENEGYGVAWRNDGLDVLNCRSVTTTTLSAQQSNIGNPTHSGPLGLGREESLTSSGLENVWREVEDQIRQKESPIRFRSLSANPCHPLKFFGVWPKCETQCRNDGRVPSCSWHVGPRLGGRAHAMYSEWE